MPASKTSSIFSQSETSYKPAYMYMPTIIYVETISQMHHRLQKNRILNSSATIQIVIYFVLLTSVNKSIFGKHKDSGCAPIINTAFRL